MSPTNGLKPASCRDQRFLVCLPSLDQCSSFWPASPPQIGAPLSGLLTTHLRRKPGIPGVRKQLTSSSQLRILLDTRHSSRTALSKDSHSLKSLVLWTPVGTSRWQARVSTCFMAVPLPLPTLVRASHQRSADTASRRCPWTMCLPWCSALTSPLTCVTACRFPQVYTSGPSGLWPGPSPEEGNGASWARLRVWGKHTGNALGLLWPLW